MTREPIVISKTLLALPRFAKTLIVIMVDASLCVVSVWLSFYLRLGEFGTFSTSQLTVVFLSIFLVLPIYLFCGVYRSIFRYGDSNSLLLIIRSTIIYSVPFASIVMFIGIAETPRTIGIIQPLLLSLFVCSARLTAKLWLGSMHIHPKYKKGITTALIYGAGSSGQQLASAMHSSDGIDILGFLDDDDSLQGQFIGQLKVHDPDELETLVAQLKIDTILLALPRINRSKRNEIIQKLKNFKVSVRTIPSFVEIAGGNFSVSEVVDLEIDDLLGRDAITPKQELLEKYSTNSVVMVTGAGGSIGSELCRQIIALEPKCLLLIDHSEFSLYHIHSELETISKQSKIIPLLVSVQDKCKISTIISAWKPNIIYHAAAYKHVPLVEHNFLEGVKNNIFGTLNVVQSAIEHGIKNLVLISTDKAVRPTSVMGASKRISEMILQALSKEQTKCILSMVRFGNVLGSSGSVVPKFREQIRNGGPLTITHPDIERFFMTIPEASQLVIQAGAMAKGGDVFVLDMGKPVKIIELARRMIQLSGLTVKTESNPNGDIEIQIGSLRPGEKLFEELLISNDSETTLHNRIIRAKESHLDWERLVDEISRLQSAIEKNEVGLARRIISGLVPDFQVKNKIVDYYYNQSSNNT